VGSYKKNKKTAKLKKLNKKKILISFFDFFDFAVKNLFVNIHSFVLDYKPNKEKAMSRNVATIFVMALREYSMKAAR
jgi:hypothetical protein